ncbi:MAG: energy transducer TonB [Candidatus Omnitrophica bacterium]|nr:energy transducer TonB [Candidatus Omnitrophota bacterium]
MSLVRATLISIGAHALALAPIAAGIGLASGPSTGVIRGVSSVELEFVAPPGRFQEPDPSASREAVAEREGEEPSLPREKGGKGGVPQQDSWADDGGAVMGGDPAAGRNPAPRYPWLARIQGWEGTVVLRVLVTPAGQAGSVQVARSSGYPSLDEAALAAIRRWSFLPARKQGQAVGSPMEIPVRFQLSKEEGRQ